MTPRFAVGLVWCTPLPWIVYRLRLASQRLDGVLAPVALDRPRSSWPSSQGSTATANLPEQRVVAPVRLVVEDRPSDPVPVVTPIRAKAGGVRRAVQAPPCHGCNCCATYATRLHDAHLELDRLRDLLLVADGRRIDQTTRRG